MNPFLVNIGLKIGGAVVSGLTGQRKRKGREAKEGNAELRAVVSLLPEKWQPWATAAFLVMVEFNRIKKDGRITVDEVDGLIEIFKRESGLENMIIYDANK